MDEDPQACSYQSIMGMAIVSRLFESHECGHAIWSISSIASPPLYRGVHFRHLEDIAV
jgi:hypothetical protein